MRYCRDFLHIKMQELLLLEAHIWDIWGIMLLVTHLIAMKLYLQKFCKQMQFEETF